MNAHMFLNIVFSDYRDVAPLTLTSKYFSQLTWSLFSHGELPRSYTVPSVQENVKDSLFSFMQYKSSLVKIRQYFKYCSSEAYCIHTPQHTP